MYKNSFKAIYTKKGTLKINWIFDNKKGRRLENLSDEVLLQQYFIAKIDFWTFFFHHHLSFLFFFLSRDWRNLVLAFLTIKLPVQCLDFNNFFYFPNVIDSDQSKRKLKGLVQRQLFKKCTNCWKKKSNNKKKWRRWFFGFSASPFMNAFSFIIFTAETSKETGTIIQFFF